MQIWLNHAVRPCRRCCRIAWPCGPGVVSSQLIENPAVPSVLDNGIHSARKLLRRVVARLRGGKQRTSGIDDPEVNERVAVVATLLPGSRERAAEILAKGAPYGLALAGFRRHSVFLAEETVIFVFEGPGIEGRVRDVVNDPVSSAAFSVWAPLLEGNPVLAREEFSWEARQQE
jgi:hypothetical protein